VLVYYNYYSYYNIELADEDVLMMCLRLPLVTNATSEYRSAVCQHFCRQVLPICHFRFRFRICVFISNRFLLSRFSFVIFRFSFSFS